MLFVYRSRGLTFVAGFVTPTDEMLNTNASRHHNKAVYNIAKLKRAL